MIRRPRGVRNAGLVISGLVVSAVGVCVDVSGSTGAPPPSLPAFAPGEIEWTSLGGGIQEGWLDVPIDYADPAGGTFRLHLARHLADSDSPIGSLFINPGGPGFGGTIHALNAEVIYGEDLLKSFDIVAWDPRGTGSSEPLIDCIDNYDEYHAGTDVTPDDDVERQQLIAVAEDFAQRCTSENETILQFVGTNNSARDIDTIRRALDEDEVTYLGFSYGAELGATWATLFPDTVRGAVLDSAPNPTGERTERLLERAVGFESTFATFLAECSADPNCAFHNDGDAAGAFDELMSTIDETPLPTVADRPALTRGMALDGVVAALYTGATWPQLADSLAAAQLRDGAPLLALYDSLYQRQADGTWANSLEAYQVISCMDTAERLTVDEEDAATKRFTAAAPRLGLAVREAYACSFFPDAADPRADITGQRAGPILLCGVTGDPATPLQGTRRMADTVEDGRLIVIEADQHICYGVDECADALIDDYLINLAVPPEETEC